MNRAIVCSATWLASLWSYSTVGEGHAVGRAIGLALIAVLIVRSVVLWLVALDLVIRDKKYYFITMTNSTSAFNRIDLLINLFSHYISYK